MNGWIEAGLFVQGFYTLGVAVTYELLLVVSPHTLLSVYKCRSWFSLYSRMRRAFDPRSTQKHIHRFYMHSFLKVRSLNSQKQFQDFLNKFCFHNNVYVLSKWKIIFLPLWLPQLQLLLELVMSDSPERLWGPCSSWSVVRLPGLTEMPLVRKRGWLFSIKRQALQCDLHWVNWWWCSIHQFLSLLSCDSCSRSCDVRAVSLT